MINKVVKFKYKKWNNNINVTNKTIMRTFSNKSYYKTLMNFDSI